MAKLWSVASNAGGGGVITSPILLPNGTAAAPSLSFVNDTDTGLYLSAANTLGFSSGGTARMLLNNTGLSVVNGLGVGTGIGNVDTNTILAARSDQDGDTKARIINGTNGASASSRVVLTSSAGDLSILAKSVAGGSTVQLEVDNTFTGGLIINQAGNNAISIRTQNAERIGISGIGAVAIGTANVVQRINGATQAAGSDAPVLGVHGPAGTTGEPALWAKINYNGTDYVLPLWTPS